jgi:predicted DNA binding CopG/RHH family protein
MAPVRQGKFAHCVSGHNQGLMLLKRRSFMKETICKLPAEYADQPTTTVSLEMPVKLLEKVKKAAILEKTDYQAVINCFVHQARGDSQAEVKRLKFEQHLKNTLKKHDVHPDAFDEIFNALEFY